MKKVIWFLMIFCSCSSSNKILVTEKNDYISYHENVYIQTHVDKDIRKINPNSDNRITIENKENDTIYVFSTVITNKNMFYSINNIEIDKKTVLINSYYKNFMKEALHSGIRKFSFIQLSPMDSLTINVDERKIKQISENKFTTIKFTYYYFKKVKNFSGNGLINLDKINIRKRSLSVSAAANL